MTEDRLTTLYYEYGAIIFARCAKLLNDRAAAEDATQETFMRVQRNIERAPSTDEALRWIYRIATNYCLNEIRNRKYRPKSVSVLPEPFELGGASPSAVLADRNLVARIVRTSPVKVRVPAWLHHVDGFDQGEVARVLGVSRRSVAYWLAEFAAHARRIVEEAHQ